MCFFCRISLSYKPAIVDFTHVLAENLKRVFFEARIFAFFCPGEIRVFDLRGWGRGPGGGEGWRVGFSPYTICQWSLRERKGLRFTSIIPWHGSSLTPTPFPRQVQNPNIPTGKKTRKSWLRKLLSLFKFPPGLTWVKSTISCTEPLKKSK